MNKRQVGLNKEELAAKYLEKQGYVILEKNFYCKAGEIDIIARDAEYLCFVEVKYRSDTENGFPEEAVDPRKTGRISRSAICYMNAAGLPEDIPCRFDVVSILGKEFLLIKNAFDAVL